MRRKRFIISISVLLFLCNSSCYHKPKESSNYLIRISDSLSDNYGYATHNGDTIIPLGKYTRCFTDTFINFAIVQKPNYGLIAINRQETILYQVFSFDNGPDEPAEGLFRIVENSKMGYASASTGEIVIPPQFECAERFKNGIARVSNKCKNQSYGEHSTWLSNSWYYIDKTGTKINPKNEQLN